MQDQFKTQTVDTSNKNQFVYGMKRSAKSTITYLKGNSFSIKEVVIENTKETVSLTEAIAKVKDLGLSFDVNSHSYVDSCFTAVVYLRF